MGFNLSSNMNLPIPQVGNEAGPQYATDINNCLTLLDQHNHTPGYGAQVPSAGIDINSDLSFNSNNLTDARSLRLDINASPLSDSSDLACLYASGVDLYFNDAAGNQIRITQSGGIAGTPGSISNLTSPASAAYVSASHTFVWESDANTPANMDGASILIRNLSANSKALTLAPPNAMAVDYTITLPVLPASTKIMALDASGNMSAPYSVDNSTINISTNTIQVKPGGITVTQLAPLNSQLSSSCGTFTNTGTSVVDVTNLTVTITTLGRPVMLQLIADGTAFVSGSPNNCFELIGSNAQAYVIFNKDGSEIASYNIEAGSTSIWPGSAFSMVDFPAAGTYTYKLQIKPDDGASSMSVFNLKLLAYEIG
jgi:hypothetical protein